MSSSSHANSAKRRPSASSTIPFAMGGAHVILPVTQSKPDLVPRSDLRYRFLTGNRPEVIKDTCGKYAYLGCLEHHKHGHKILSGQTTIQGGSAKPFDIIKSVRLSCGRLDCPICYEKACAQHAIKIEQRMKQFRWTNRNKTKYYHWTVSVPNYKDMEKTPQQLRRKALRVAKMAGIKGGVIIFHHLRSYNQPEEGTFKEGSEWKTSPAKWHFSPHFHVMGVGFTGPNSILKTYNKTGWVVKNLGERESIRATALYQLSHAYIPEKKHAIVWFGVMSYNNFKSKKVPVEKATCPECGEELKKVKPVNPEAEAIVKSKITEEGIYVIEAGLFEYSKPKSRKWIDYG